MLPTIFNWYCDYIWLLYIRLLHLKDSANRHFEWEITGRTNTLERFCAGKRSRQRWGCSLGLGWITCSCLWSWHQYSTYPTPCPPHDLQETGHHSTPPTCTVPMVIQGSKVTLWRCPPITDFNIMVPIYLIKCNTRRTQNQNPVYVCVCVEGGGYTFQAHLVSRFR